MFARDLRNPDGPLVYLERGSAERMRATTKQWLQCPVSGCRAPQLTTVGGLRRHHFRHLPNTDPDHRPDSVEHFTAKHLIARWVKSQDPDAVVRVDDIVLPSGRRPDVYVESRGYRIVYEIQYSPLTRAELKARRDDYAADGVVDVWLFGHTGPLCRLAEEVLEETEPAFQLAQPFLEILRRGQPLLWINPFEELVATAVFGWDEFDLLRLSYWTSAPKRLRCDIAPLDECRMEVPIREGFGESLYWSWFWSDRSNAPEPELSVPDFAGFVSPAGAVMLTEFGKRLVPLRRPLEEMADRIEEARREADPYRRWLAARPEFESRYGDLPDVIEANVVLDAEETWAATEHWRAVLLEEFDAVVGSQVDREWMQDVLLRRLGPKADGAKRGLGGKGRERGLDEQVVSFLYLLRDTGWVSFEAGDRYWIRPTQLVTIHGSLMRRPAGAREVADRSDSERFWDVRRGWLRRSR